MKTNNERIYWFLIFNYIQETAKQTVAGDKDQIMSLFKTKHYSKPECV